MPAQGKEDKRVTDRFPSGSSSRFPVRPTFPPSLPACNPDRLVAAGSGESNWLRREGAIGRHGDCAALAPAIFVGLCQKEGIALSELDEAKGATVFLGPDIEQGRLLSRRDTRDFNSLSEAVAWVLSDMPSSRRWGCYVQTSSGVRYDWDDLGELDLSSGGEV